LQPLKFNKGEKSLEHLLDGQGLIHSTQKSTRATSKSIECQTHETLLKKNFKETLSYSNQESAIGHSIQLLNRVAVSLLLIDLADRYWI